jgi:sulfur carrier protein
MTIFVNGEPREVAAGLTVGALVSEAGTRAGRGVAVAVDAEVVPRGEWERTELSEGQRVEILVAVQGG